MNIALWTVQILLAIVYFGAGVIKTFNLVKAREQLAWVKRHSNHFVRFVGVVEILGAIGLLLPLITGILPWLTPVAALGLALIQVLAFFAEHLPNKEYNSLTINALLFTLAAFVAYGRFSLFPW